MKSPSSISFCLPSYKRSSFFTFAIFYGLKREHPTSPPSTPTHISQALYPVFLTVSRSGGRKGRNKPVLASKNPDFTLKNDSHGISFFRLPREPVHANNLTWFLSRPVHVPTTWCQRSASLATAKGSSYGLNGVFLL